MKIFKSIFVIAAIGSVVIVSQLLYAQNPGDNRPILKESPERLVGLIGFMAGENRVAASINVAHDAASQRIRIFTIAEHAGRKGAFKSNGYEVEIIYNTELDSMQAGAGSYRFQHNLKVLEFAASQVTAGNKAWGRWLMGVLAEAEPDLFWNDATHPDVSIGQMVAKLETGDETVKAFLSEESQHWAQTVKYYGPENAH